MRALGSFKQFKDLYQVKENAEKRVYNLFKKK